MLDPYRASDESSDLASEWDPGVSQAASGAIHGSLLDYAYQYCEREAITKLNDEGSSAVLRWLRELSEYLGHPQPRSVSTQDAARYVEFLSGTGKARATAMSRIGRFKRVWKYWKTTGVVVSNPWLDIDLSDYGFTSTVGRQGISPEAYHELHAEIGERTTPATADLRRAFVELGVTAGLCRSELFGLRPQDVSETTIDGRTRYVFNVQGGKTTNAVRSIPVPLCVTSLVVSLVAQERPYLLHDGDPRLVGKSVSVAITKALKRCIKTSTHD